VLAWVVLCCVWGEPEGRLGRSPNYAQVVFCSCSRKLGQSPCSVQNTTAGGMLNGSSQHGPEANRRFIQVVANGTENISFPTESLDDVKDFKKSKIGVMEPNGFAEKETGMVCVVCVRVCVVVVAECDSRTVT